MAGSRGWSSAAAGEASARADSLAASAGAAADAATAPLAGVELREVVARLEPAASLRSALELILTARTSIALVAAPDGSYLGAVTLETIRAGLSA